MPWPEGRPVGPRRRCVPSSASATSEAGSRGRADFQKPVGCRGKRAPKKSAMGFFHRHKAARYWRASSAIWPNEKRLSHLLECGRRPFVECLSSGLLHLKCFQQGDNAQPAKWFPTACDFFFGSDQGQSNPSGALDARRSTLVTDPRTDKISRRGLFYAICCPADASPKCEEPERHIGRQLGECDQREVDIRLAAGRGKRCLAKASAKLSSTSMVASRAFSRRSPSG
jgi:hypothetical protein